MLRGLSGPSFSKHIPAMEIVIIIHPVMLVGIYHMVLLLNKGVISIHHPPAPPPPSSPSARPRRALLYDLFPHLLMCTSVRFISGLIGRRCSMATMMRGQDFCCILVSATVLVGLLPPGG